MRPTRWTAPWKIRQEVGHISSRRSLLIACAIAVSGCASHSSDSKKQAPEKKADTSPVQLIETSDGFAIYRGKKDEKLWNVYWKNGEMAVAMKQGEKPKRGKLDVVHGDIFKAEKVASKYQADHGEVDRQTNILKLTGNVRVDSADPAIILTCDTLTYEGTPKIMKAKGHVHIDGSIGTVGTIDELWTTADFSKIASPEQFNQP